MDLSENQSDKTQERPLCKFSWGYFEKILENAHFKKIPTDFFFLIDEITPPPLLREELSFLGYYRSVNKISCFVTQNKSGDISILACPQKSFLHHTILPLDVCDADDVIFQAIIHCVERAILERLAWTQDEHTDSRYIN